MQSNVLQLVFLLVGSTCIQAANFLLKRPDELTPCSTDATDFKDCLKRNLQEIFINWTDGLPGTNIIGPVDPFAIKQLILSRTSPKNDSNPININADVQNILVSGVSQAKIVDLNYYRNDTKAKILLSIPNLNIDFNYSVKGNVAERVLNDQGKGQLKVEKILVVFEADLVPRVAPQGNVIDVQHVAIHFREIRKIKFKLDKLFGGDKYVEKLTHDLLNENWVEFYVTWRPIIEYVIETMTLLRSRKIFSYIPGYYLIGNYGVQ